MKAIRTIGFTGTIASGKTSRCKHLVEVAKEYQRGLVLPTSVAHPTHSSTPFAAGAASATATPALHLPQPVFVHYINADLVGHNIYEPGKPCYKELIQHFGTAILPRTPTSSSSTAAAAAAPPPTSKEKTALPYIDRRVLGDIVFADERKLQELNAICWPYISAAIRAEHAAVVARATTASAAPPAANIKEVSASTNAAAAVALIIVEAALLCEMTDVLALTTDVWMTHCTADTAIDRAMARNGLSREAAERRVASQRDVGQKLLAMRDLSYRGDIEVFDTTQVTLAEGLKETEKAFDRFWKKKVLPHIA